MPRVMIFTLFLFLGCSIAYADLKLSISYAFIDNKDISLDLEYENVGKDTLEIDEQFGYPFMVEYRFWINDFGFILLSPHDVNSNKYGAFVIPRTITLSCGEKKKYKLYFNSLKSRDEIRKQLVSELIKEIFSSKKFDLQVVYTYRKFHGPPLPRKIINISTETW